eukprot:s1969_g7.t1
MHPREGFNLIPKWTHTVNYEPDFVSEWQAAEKAFQLASSLGFSSAQMHRDPLPARRGLKPVQVSFARSFELILGPNEESIRHFFAVQLPSEVLKMPDKPWKLSHDVKSVISSSFPPHNKNQSAEFHAHQSHDTSYAALEAVPSIQRYNMKDGSVPHCHVVEGPLESVLFKSRVNEQLSQWGSLESCRTCGPPVLLAEGETFEQLACSTIGIVPSPLPRAIRFRQDKLLSKKTDMPATNEVLSLQGLDMEALCGNESAPVQFPKGSNYSEGTQISANLQAASVNFVNSVTCRSPQSAPVSFRRNFESPLIGFVGQDADDDTDEDDEGNPRRPFAPILPAFAIDIAARARGLGLDPNSPDFDLPVRSWFLDHMTMRRWFSPRLLQLVGPAHTWEAQIAALWVDQINPDFWFDVTVVDPSPPRPARHAFVTYDIIIAQSIDLPRYAGLVTVHPSKHEATFQMYSVAISFPEMVSGYSVVQASDAARYCRYRHCTITQRWFELQNTMRATHQMGHGDSFQVFVQMRNPEMTNSQTAPMDHTSSGASSSHQPPGQSHASSSQSSSANHTGTGWDMHHFMTTMHVFPFEGDAVVITLVNDQDIAPSQTIAQALGVPLQNLEALHQIPIRPDDIPRQDVAVIAQCTGNIEVGENCRLLLIDIFYHNHPAGQGHHTRPTQVRNVKCTAAHILRDSLFTAASVYQYCTLITQHCTVELDGIPWPSDDWNPRRVHHGSYARVDVPPPQGYDLPTHQAASALETDAIQGLDTIANLFGEDDLDPATSLLQQSVTIQAVSTDERPFCHGQGEGPLSLQAVLNPLSHSHLAVSPLPVNPCRLEHAQVAPIPTCKPDAKPSEEPRNHVDEDIGHIHHSLPTSEQLMIRNTKASRHFAATGTDHIDSGVDVQEEGPLSCVAVLNPLHKTPDANCPEESLANCVNLTYAMSDSHQDIMQQPEKSPRRETTSGPETGKPRRKRQRKVKIDRGQTTLLSFVQKKAIDASVHSHSAKQGALHTASNGSDAKQEGQRHDQHAEVHQSPDAPDQPAVQQQNSLDSTSALEMQSRCKQRPCTSGSNRHTLHAFFARKSPKEDSGGQELGGTKPPSPGIQVSPDPSQVVIQAEDKCLSACVQARCSESQVASGPVYERSVPPVAPPQFPPQGGNTMWRLDLQTTFEELAFVEHAVTGPVMYVQVWYVDHIDTPTARQQEWYALMMCMNCGTRTSADHGLITSPCRSPFMYGLCILRHHTLFMSMLQSMSYWNKMLAVNMWHFCSPRPFMEAADLDFIRMFSGQLQFYEHEEDEIHSGISVLLDIGTPIQQSTDESHRPGSSTDAVSLLQTKVTRTTQVHPPQHLPPQLFIPSMLEFSRSLKWHIAQYHADTWKCAGGAKLPIVTWFIDMTLQCRTCQPRRVLLSTHPSRWIEDILHAWDDKLESASQIDLQVVTPDPCSLGTDQMAHVIVVQKPLPDFAAVLVDITDTCPPLSNQQTCIVVPVLVTVDEILALTADLVEDATDQIEIRQGANVLPRQGQYHVRTGHLLMATQTSLEMTHRDDSESVRRGFVAVHQHIQNARLALIEAMRCLPCLPCWPWVSSDSPGPDTHDGSTVPTSNNPMHPMPGFFQELKQMWRPLAALGPAGMEESAPVLTWFIDHIRLPQCFRARAVQLFEDELEWMDLIRRTWADAILPDRDLHIFLVRPPPVEMEPQVVAHLLVVQQPLPNFRTILVTTFDSSFPGIHRRHASMCPQEMSQFFLYGLAFLDRDCNNPQNTCSAWCGDQELLPDERVDTTDGQAFTVAIHRNIAPGPADENPWEFASSSSTPHRVILHLQASIPDVAANGDTPLDDSKPQLLWFENPAWKIELQEQKQLCLYPLPDGLHIPPVSYWELMKEPQPGPYPAFTLYVDGSANGIHAAWAVVVTAQAQDGFEAFIGCTYGTVPIQPDHPAWIGADTSDNIAAELSALAVAQMLVLQWPSQTQLCIRPDLSLSRTISEATTTCRSNRLLAQICKSLGLWISGKASIVEVRGHTQHPWNELADSIAKWAMKTGQSSADPELSALHQYACAPQDVAWSWMQTTHFSMAACFPTLIDQQILQIDPANQALPVTPTERSLDTQHQDTPVKWTLLAKTANVLATEVWGSKPLEQSALVKERSVWISSGTEQERISSVDNQDRPITLGDAVFTVQHADPRRLFVQAQLDALKMTFVTLHTPCLGSPQQNQPPPLQVLKDWWDETSSLVSKFVPSSFAWIFIDANSPLDQGDDVLFGSHGAETLTKQGELFRSFLQRHELAVPSTFAELHTGITTTWTHSSGNKSRKDYVLLPKDMLQVADSSWVDHDHDTSFSHEDHLPVALLCTGWSALATSKDKFQWDEQALLNPARVQAFRHALCSLPLPKWDLAVDSHAAIYEKQLLSLAKQFFAQPPAKTRKIQLTPDTLKAIQFKRHVLDFGRATGCIAYPCFKAELKEIEKHVHKLVRHDVQEYYSALIRQLEKAGEMSNHRLVYRLLQKLGRKKGGKPPGPRPLPVLRKDDGTMASSFQEQQQIWMSQFSAIEAGLPTTWTELEACNSRPSTLKPHEVDPAAYPTSWMIQELLAKLKRDKVPGPNLIPPGVMKAGGEILSRHLAVLFAKATSQAKEPMLWKGGVLVPLWKGKASPELPSAYRSIFISNYTTKLFHQCIRQHLVNLWETGLGQMQYGGRAGMGADVAHHVVQCHQEWAKQKSCPSAALFVDIRSAFYTVLRQTFTSLPNDNSAFFAAMTRLGLTIEEVAKLVKVAEKDAVAAGLSMHMQHILHDLMTNTYFTLQGISQPCNTTQGTRPGDPIADVLFNLCMTVLLKDFHEQVRAAEGPAWLGTGVPVSDFCSQLDLPSEGYADVTFVDDAALLVHARTNEQIVSMIQCLVQSFVNAASRRGLEVNFDKGKTELLWNIIGRGARAMKVTIHQQGDVLQWSSNDVDFRLHVCHEYKHLGTWIQTKHRHARELSMRAGAAKQQWGQLARSFFTRPLSIPVKAKVFQSLVVSKAVYNAHTWTGISDKDLESWTNQLRAPVATMLKGKLVHSAKFMHTTDELFAYCGMLPLHEQVHANRLRFLARLLRVCPPLTWALLCHTDGAGNWRALCMESCAWMQKHCTGRIPGTDATFHDWIQFVRLDAKWKGRIRQTVKSAISYHQAKATQSIWQRHFEARLQRNGATLPADPASKPRPQLWQCELCPKVFGSTQALAMHAHRDHGYKKKVRYYAAGETCPVCLQFFHTRKRLSIHLEKGPRCYSVVQACWPPLPAADVQALDDSDKVVESQLRRNGWWAAKAFQPVLQALGPSLPPLNHPESQIMFDRVQRRRPSDTQSFDQLQGRQIQAVPEDDPQVWWTRSDLPAFIMHSVQGTDKGGGAYSMFGLAKEAAILHVRALVIVHFFSGFRREGDIHNIIDQHVAATGVHIFTLSVDLCMQRQHADLATDSALRWWGSRVAAGQIVSAGGGPPCETYTAARFHALEGRPGPRPLRSAEEHCGLPKLTRKERMQIWIGDSLLRFLLDILAILAACGMSGWIEHPQYPTWCVQASPASIWATTALKLLKGLHCCTVVSFDQCTCGAEGKKPTTLLLLRLPWVRTQLLKRGDFGRCHHHPGTHTALIGKQENGAFQTAKAKIYPKGLNNILAQAMFQFATQFSGQEVVSELPPDFQPFTVQQYADKDTDDKFLASIDRAMDPQSDSNSTWRCGTCMKICAKTHAFCGVCGRSWHMCADPTFQSGQKSTTSNRHVQWAYDDWDTEGTWNQSSWNQDTHARHQQHQWTKSPRRRQSPRRRTGKKGGGKSTDQTKGKGKAPPSELEPLGPPSLASIAALDPPWNPTASMGPAVPPSAPPSGQEDKQLKNIIAALQKHTEVLPPEVQAIVQDAAMKDSQQETKKMHSAVAAHGRARKELQQAQLARHNLHTAWKGFLGHAVTQWQTYSSQFIDQEKQLTDRVNNAINALEQAKENLAKTKSSVGVESKEDAMGVSEDDADLAKKDLTDAASVKILESFTGLQTSLEAMKTSAEQMVEAEQHALKRPRLDPQNPNADGDNPPPNGPGFG